MISYLNGKIIKINSKGIIVDIGNIGYFVHTTKNLLSTLKEKEDIELMIHSHIREDLIDLYGIPTYEELEFFKALLSVSGIGPKVALEMLNQPMGQIKKAIIEEDISFISRTSRTRQKNRTKTST